MRKVPPKTTCIKKPFQGNNFSPLGSMEIGGAPTLLVQMVSTPMAPKTAKFGGMSGMSILFTSGYLLTSWYTLEWREFADNVTFRCVGVILIRIFFYCFSYVSYVCFYKNHQERNFLKNISGFPVRPSILSGAGKADHQSRWRKVTWMESQVLVLPSHRIPGSMHGIFTYIWLILMVNVSKHTVHGSFG